MIFFITFSQFLNDNFDYDESTALEQLLAFGLKNFMFDVAKVCGYIPEGGGGGGDSHMKQSGMLVVPLRGVNFGFWSRLGCSGQSANILSHQGLVRVPRRT